MYTCEGQKWDLEYEVRKRDWEVLPTTTTTTTHTETKKTLKPQNRHIQIDHIKKEPKSDSENLKTKKTWTFLFCVQCVCGVSLNLSVMIFE